MKAIILVAIFAFVAQASLLDTTDYTLGFNEQLGFGYVETNSGMQCFSSINQTVADVISIIQSFQNGEDGLAMSVLDLVSTVNGELKDNCEEYATDVVNYVASASNVTDAEDLKYVVERNAEQYLSQLIQQVTKWIDAIAAGDEYEAGATEAYIIQILVGAETPAQFTYPNITYQDYVPLNYTELITEAYGALYSVLGFDGQAASEAYLQCFSNVSVAVPAIEEFVSDFKQAQGLAKIEVVRTAFDDLDFVVQSCAPVVGLVAEVYAPVFESIKEAPLRTILTILHNVASNLPQLEQIDINSQAEIFTGNYTQVGIATASELSIIFAGAGY